MLRRRRQFSHEAETLFPPLLACEVTGTRVEGLVLVVEAKFALNMLSLTLKQARSERREAKDKQPKSR